MTKVAPVAGETEAETGAAAVDVEPPVAREVDVSLGPFFALGAVLTVLGLLRRKPLAFLAGLGAIWVDQRSPFGQRLKQQIRARARR